MAELKLKHEEEMTGNSNQLTLKETCTSLLDLLENVADKNEIEETEERAIADNWVYKNDASYLEPPSQSDGDTETNESATIELDSYNIEQETQGIAAELETSSPVEAQSTPMEYQISTSDETSFACNICTEKFSTDGSFGKHLLQHLQKSFYCDQY